MFFASNWFYTWQFSGFNGAIFNIRARGLNNVCYWISQIIGSILIGLLDRKSISHRVPRLHRMDRPRVVLHFLWFSWCDVADSSVLAYGCDVE
ncbi:uncharacterized protein ARMOST_08582 [Armillaria ostoyae]|uniref:Uncharacterized protein n=1 Tax=Armillaria ostoyae TaxID=47428 RepID=A0A284R930_ARMOS|nr:uncharacterized protein ARMOST_08582 [Armillaria ostoyae]